MEADDPRALGASLRALVDKTAADVARTTVNAAIDVQKAAQSTLEGRLQAVDALVKGLDLREATAVYEAVRDEQSRLRDSRDLLREDLRKARAAEAQLQVLAMQLMQTNTLHEAAAVAIAKTIGDMHSDLDLRAARAAAVVVEDLRGHLADDAVAKVDLAIARMQDAFAAMVKTAGERIEELISKADAGDALVPLAYRGPYRDGATYQRGEMALSLGSTFIATRITKDRPRVSKDPAAPWQLLAAGGFGGAINGGRSKRLDDHENRLHRLESASGG